MRCWLGFIGPQVHEEVGRRSFLDRSFFDLVALGSLPYRILERRWRGAARTGTEGTQINVTVLVLGDIGRSPRMQFHALALAELPAEVDLIGYAGSRPHEAVRTHPRIRLHAVAAPRLAGRRDLSRSRFLFSSGVRIVRQVLEVGRRLLVDVRRPDFLLVQNPPAVPTLLLAALAARLRGARLVVDWHNFGYAMLGLRLGASHPAVRAARWYERQTARLADAHLCVSRSMKRELEQEWGLGRVRVLYDRPASVFAPAPREKRGELLERLGERAAPAATGGESGLEAGLVITSTSWTADEDFSLLLDALTTFDREIRERETEAGRPLFRPLVVVATGEGPLRAHYEERFANLGLERVRMCTGWLEPEDYAALLGTADVGLSLHRSACGHDLPMKVLDMFGAGLPVLALDYGPCLAELVRDGENGLLFDDSEALAAHLLALFEESPEASQRLDDLRDRVRAAQRVSWAEGWNEEARPLFEL